MNCIENGATVINCSPIFYKNQSLMSSINRFILKILDWKFEGKIPRELKKCVFIVYPHTSGWDLIMGFIIRSAIDLEIKYIGKAELFNGPFAWFFYWTGGQPVVRQKSTNYVDSVVKVFNEKEVLRIAMSPEGTRKRVEKFRTGFYYIALGAKIPIVMVQFNFGDKIIHFAEPFEPSGNINQDMEMIYDHYRGIKGKIPIKGFL